MKSSYRIRINIYQVIPTLRVVVVLPQFQPSSFLSITYTLLIRTTISKKGVSRLDAKGEGVERQLFNCEYLEIEK
jgi:hypothetical protein